MILVMGFVAVVLCLVVWQVVSIHKKTSTNNTTTYYDPNSKETITTTPGKSPETYGNSSSINYLGYSKLLDIGTTQTQLDAIKQATSDFSKTNNLGITEASIQVENIKPVLNDTESGVDFPLIINRGATFSIKVRYLSLDTISFTAYSGSTKIFQTSNSTPASDPSTSVE